MEELIDLDADNVRFSLIAFPKHRNQSKHSFMPLNKKIKINKKEEKKNTLYKEYKKEKEKKKTA